MTDSAPVSVSSSDERARSGPSVLTATLPWVARLAWLLTAVVGGAAVESALDGRSQAVRWVAAIGGWTAFAVVAVALLIPSVRSLTATRVLSPLTIVVSVVVAVAGAPGLDVALLVIPVIVAVAAIFSPEVGRWMVQASAYGDEERLPLRSPVPAGTAAVITWVAWAASVLAAPLALAARAWVIGVIAAIVAVAGVVFVGPRWHKMSQRWLVLVPAGVVVHDPLVLADTLMVRTNQLLGIGLARADTEAADLTGPASGYAVQIDTSEPVSTVFAFTPQVPNGKAIHMTAFLVAPTRPGEALRLAAARNLPIR